MVAGCGGGETVSPAPETVEGTVPQETVDAAAGDPEAGKAVFADQGCGSCHAFEAAGSTATVGPDLDEALQGKDADFILESIVKPDAQVAEGYSPDLMPEDYDQKLDDQQLADLVAFLTPKS